MKTWIAVVVIAVASISAYSQTKRVAAPSESVSLEEQQRWLVSALEKFGKSKTRTTSVTISNPKVEGCVLSFVRTKKYNSTSQDTVAITTRVDKVKDDVSISLGAIDLSTLKISDNIYPELSNLSFTVRRSETDLKEFEIVLQFEAVEAILATLRRIAAPCREKS